MDQDVQTQITEQSQQTQTMQVQQTQEQRLMLNISGRKVHSPRNSRRYLYVELEGDVNINSCFEWINKIVPVEILEQIKVEPSTMLERTLVNIDIIENRYRGVVINMNNDRVEFELKALSSKHEYDITLRIENKSEAENTYRVVTRVVVDGQKRFEEETTKYADGFDIVKLPTIILLKRFAEFLDIISKIVDVYRVLKMIPTKCIYASSLQLNICKH